MSLILSGNARLVILLLISFSLVCSATYEVEPSGSFRDWETLLRDGQRKIVNMNTPATQLITSDGFINDQIGFPLSRTALSIFAHYLNEQLSYQDRGSISLSVDATSSQRHPKKIDLLIGASVLVHRDFKGPELQIETLLGKKATELINAIRKTLDKFYEIKGGYSMGNALYAKPSYPENSRMPTIRAHGEQATLMAMANENRLRVDELGVKSKSENAVFYRVQVGGASDRPPCFGCSVMQQQSSDNAFYNKRNRNEDFQSFKTELMRIYHISPDSAGEFAEKLLRQAYGERYMVDSGILLDTILNKQPSLAGQLYLQSFVPKNVYSRPGLTEISNGLRYESVLMSNGVKEENSPIKWHEQIDQANDVNTFASKIKIASGNFFGRMADINLDKHARPLRLFLYAVAAYSTRDPTTDTPLFPELSAIPKEKRNAIYDLAMRVLTGLFDGKGTSFTTSLDNLNGPLLPPRIFDRLDESIELSAGSYVYDKKFDYQRLMKYLDSTPHSDGTKGWIQNAQSALENWYTQEKEKEEKNRDPNRPVNEDPAKGNSQRQKRSHEEDLERKPDEKTKRQKQEKSNNSRNRGMFLGKNRQKPYKNYPHTKKN